MQNVIAAYNRKQAVEDGEQVDVSNIARQAEIRFQVFLTRKVFDAYVTVPPNVPGEDKSWRLWDIIWTLRQTIQSSPAGTDRLSLPLCVRNHIRRTKLVELLATYGALDADDSQTVITVMMPDEE